MYDYKHNHIQIMPKYRHLFKGKMHILFIQKKREDIYLRMRGGLMSTCDDDGIQRIGKHWYAWVRRNRYLEDFKQVSIVEHFAFCLLVPELPGNVDGMYFNSTCSISTVKRKLKRMLGCRRLNVVYVEDIYEREPDDSAYLLQNHPV